MSAAPWVAWLAPLLALATPARAALPSPGGISPTRNTAEREFDVRRFGARGDGVADDSRAIQAALDAARLAGGGVVRVPAGTYLVAPPGPRLDGVSLHSLRIGSRVSLRGVGRESVIRVKDGVGSYRALLSGDPADGAALADVTLSDLRFDQRCATSGGDVRVGEPGHEFLVFLAWGGTRISVERVVFDAVCGVNTVSVNAPSARDLAVRDSRFRFVRGPTTDPTGFYDNSAVYLHGTGLSATGNLFESTAADGARGAIELHGARGRATGNVTRWYRSCVRVVGTSGRGEAPPAAGNDLEVRGNLCADANDAINVWPVTGHGVRGVTIQGNTVTLAPEAHAFRDRTLQAYAGISLVWDAASGDLDGDVDDLLVEGNDVSAAPHSGAYRPRAPESSGGILLVARGNIRGATVARNLLRDIPTKGIHLQAMGRTSRARRVLVEENVIVDPGTDRSSDRLRAGILVAGRLEEVEVAGNAVVGTRLPFRGHLAIRAAPAPGSGRVALRDNAWDTGDPGASYACELPGGDAGAQVGATRALVVTAASASRILVDPARARVWDVTLAGGGDLAIEVAGGRPPAGALTLRLRDLRRGAPGRLTWSGLDPGGWTPPAGGHLGVMNLAWDGRGWRRN